MQYTNTNKEEKWKETEVVGEKQMLVEKKRITMFTCFSLFSTSSASTENPHMMSSVFLVKNNN